MVPDTTPATTLPRVYFISDGDANTNHSILLKYLTLLPHSLPCIVQIREKQLTSRWLFELAVESKALLRSKNALIIINERVDIALAAFCDGVHLPENACSPDLLRPFAPNMLFGCSVHSAASLRRAEDAGADYLIVSPIFDTPSKRQYGAPQGLKKLGLLCSMTSLPIFALGGITLENAEYCVAEGAYGIAGISLFKEFVQNPMVFIETLNHLYLKDTL